MKVKTAELEGAALNWAVAIALGGRVTGYDDGTKPNHRQSLDYPGTSIDDWDNKGPHPRLECASGEVVYLCNCQHKKGDSLPDYSNDWSQGGPLIESHGIGVIFIGGLEGQNCWQVPTYSLQETHPKPLVIAMRALVAAKLGAEIEIPDELAQ